MRHNKGDFYWRKKKGGALCEDVGRTSTSLGEMALKGIVNVAQQGLARAVKSDYVKNRMKQTANKYLDEALDSFVNDTSRKISGGSAYNAYDVNQVLPMSMYAPDGVNDPTHPLYEGGSFDIHKAIGKLPKPKSSWTLFRHKYTGPYNDLDKQLRFDPKTGQILEIYDPPTGSSDAIAMQHDVDYSVCANTSDPKKCKNAADRKMVKALDALPYSDRQWEYYLARNAINIKQKLGLGLGGKKKSNPTPKGGGKRNKLMSCINPSDETLQSGALL